MRDSSSWMRSLRKQLGSAIPIKFSNFARIELMLYALQAYFPQQSIRKAHLLMQGYREPGITDSQWQIIKHLRHLAPEFRSSISWEIALRNYDDMANGHVANWLGFQLDYENNRITLTNSMVIQRYDLYENVLTEQPLEFDTSKKYNPAPAGNYQFNISSEQTRLVRISDAIANIGTQNQNNILSINLSHNRSPIRISLQQLIQQGRNLQSVIGYDAGQIIANSNYWNIQNNRQADEIYINGESHILGPTGSGKSTLIESLITLLIKQNKRIAIATNSVGEVQDWLEFAQQLGIKAVPIIGTSERHKHLSRLNQAIMFGDSQQSFTHPGFRWLSQCCPLFAIATPSTQQSTSQRRNKTPCFNQLEDIDNPKQKKYDCPLVGVCPQHITPQELEEAQLIVGTLPGFIHKKVSRHDLKENITILEYLALTTDLFVVDEVDLAQPKLDELFYPIVTLASFKPIQDTLMRNEFYQHVNSVFEGEVVVLERFRDSFLEESEGWKFLASKAIGDVMYSLRDIASAYKGKQPTEIEKLLKECAQEGRLFAAWSLFDSLAEHLSGKIKLRLGQKVRKPTANKYERSYQRYRQILKPIQDNPNDPSLTGLNTKDSKIVTKLAYIAGILSGQPFSKIPHPKCVEFIKETKWDIGLVKLESDVELFTNNLATLLQLSIFATQALGALGKHVSTRRQSSSELGSNLPLIPPVDFERLLPASPVGAVTSAQYQDESHLKIHWGICIGRSLFSQWQEIFSVDGLAPSHLLVTSATSYSGEEKQSYPFHVQQKPSLLIEPPPEKAKQVAYESEFFFCPVSDDAGDPVWVSGSQKEERLDNIGKMVSGLCRPSAHGQPLIDRFQDYLVTKVSSDRKNLLLITNSYAEARTFYDCLKSPYKEKASFVVRDGDRVLWASATQNSNVPRSKMTEFPSLGKELLIAPIGAISRAVNLMHPDNPQEPYFGGMVILVRQHPRPDDNQLIISAVNKNAVDNIGSRSVATIQSQARDTRDTFLAVPQIFSQLPDEIQGVAMKQPLVWTLAVNLTQLIGRSTRGGRKTVVWFTDAAFMPQTSQGNRAGDTEQNSLLLAVRKLLGDAVNQGGSSSRLIRTLYGPVYYPMTGLTHFISGVKL